MSSLLGADPESKPVPELCGRALGELKLIQQVGGAVLHVPHFVGAFNRESFSLRRKGAPFLKARFSGPAAGAEEEEALPPLAEMDLCKRLQLRC